MTQKEKILELKTTIEFLYEKEGRSKSYIAKLLNVDRSTLSKQINEWTLKQKSTYRLTPSNQKFANKHKILIKSRYDNDIPETKIAAELGVSRDYLRYIVERVEVLKKAKTDSINRQQTKTTQYNYDYTNIEGEVWKEILGYNNYYVSNMGRVKQYNAAKNTYMLIEPKLNTSNNLFFVRVKSSTLQVARLVGFAFVSGHSKENNTIEFKDNNTLNVKADNLTWVSDNKDSKRKFKKIVVDNKYEFKTIQALSKFLNVSWTQASRYLDGECKIDRDIKIIY